MERPGLQKIIGDYDVFLAEIKLGIAQSGISIRDLAQLDHICYRTETNEQYEAKKQQLKSVAKLLGEVSVAGRPISTFKLLEPLMWYDQRIDAIELPAPKASSPYPEGLEHAEFVIFDSLEEFMTKYSHLEFDTKSIGRMPNPEIGLKLGRLGVKFHLLALTHVVFLEEQLGIEEK